MNTEILQGKKEMLKQRLRILILQNASEGSEYDDKFLLEMRQISEQLLLLRHMTAAREKTVLNRATGMMPVFTAHT